MLLADPAEYKSSVGSSDHQLIKLPRERLLGCKDPAESAQVMPLMQMPRPGFSYLTLGVGVRVVTAYPVTNYATGML